MEKEELNIIRSSGEAHSNLLFRQIDRINIIGSFISGDYNKDKIISFDGAVKTLKGLLMKSIFNNPTIYEKLNELDVKKKELYNKTHLSTADYRKKYYEYVMEQYILLLLVYENFYLIEEVIGSDAGSE